MVKAAVRLSPVVPRVGTKVTAAGYHDLAVHGWRQGGQLGVGWKTALAHGEISEVFSPYRDRGTLNFPCFRMTSVLQHAMSGGPVFNEEGSVCGVSVYASTFDTNSYAALLWPAMGHTVEMKDEASGALREFTLLELIERNHVVSDGSHNRVRVHREPGGKRTIEVNIPSDLPVTVPGGTA